MEFPYASVRRAVNDFQCVRVSAKRENRSQDLDMRQFFKHMCVRERERKDRSFKKINCNLSYAILHSCHFSTAKLITETFAQRYTTQSFFTSSFEKRKRKVKINKKKSQFFCPKINLISRNYEIIVQ